jgi:ElaA protein
VANAPAVHSATFDELSARTFHDIVRLRLDTFIVEQDCPYHELDGRDILPETVHVWAEADGEVVAYLRMYPGVDRGTWIGRVVTAPTHRNRGLGAQLMNLALAMASRPVWISAQARLEAWYARLGFVRTGEDFMEDGIAHTPMRLDS